MLLLVALMGLMTWGAPHGSDVARAWVVVSHLSGNTAAWSSRLGIDETTEEQEASFESPEGYIQARYYFPKETRARGALVLLHGIHGLGISEPRLQRLARSLAHAGVAVLTPQLPGLSQFQLRAGDVETIGHAAEQLVRKAHPSTGKVGVFGISFAGGLAMVTASHPRFRSVVGYCVTLGAHEDAERVLSFFATNEVPWPDGHRQSLVAHGYGPLVFIASHASDFFPEQDEETARRVLHLWLLERKDEARTEMRRLSQEGQRRMELLVAHEFESLREEMLVSIRRHGDEALAVSPRSVLGAWATPLFVLHGADDAVIPAAEAFYFRREVPPPFLRQWLVSAALDHASLHGTSAWIERGKLLNFVAAVLEQARWTHSASP
jgi:dienelactone hydrolase